jgi:peroxiredoxin
MANPAEPSDALEASTKPKARDLNNVVRYTMWSVFKIDRSSLNSPPAQLANEVTNLLADLADSEDVKVRGWYDVAGFRADADVMLWTHAPTSDSLQTLYHRLLKTGLGDSLTGVWSQMALHRPAEFNKSHVPAFLAEERARNYVSVYPFVRSFEWYLLPDKERRELLAEHGQMGRGYPDVRANTVPAFSLGDYEWILAFEADELDRIVDLMRHLRASRARLHVREEIPFYTGRRWELADYLSAIC